MNDAKYIGYAEKDIANIGPNVPPAIVPSGYVYAERRRARVVASVIGCQSFEKEPTAVMCSAIGAAGGIDEESDDDNSSDGGRCASFRSILLGLFPKA